MDPNKLICDIGELNHLFRNSMSIEHFLQQTVEMVAKHLETDVCSIYIYDEDEKLLVLKATEGLHPEVNEKINLKLGKGLVGKSLKELRAINVQEASKHPDFEPFEGIDEEKFDNFLAIPIARGLSRIGVLSLQREKKHVFSTEDEIACQAVASQLANIIENAKFLMALHVPSQYRRDEQGEKIESLKANVASRGFAHAKSVLIDRDRTFKKLTKTPFEGSYGLGDLENAIEKTENQLETLQKQVEEKLSDAASLIFASHLLILKDKEFVGTMGQFVKQGASAPEAVLQVAEEYIEIFGASENDYVREKIQDVEDLTVRIIGNLVSDLEELGSVRGRVVIAKDLFPSDLLKFSSEEVAGIILASGGVTSHLSILARSLEIPMVIANEPKLLNIADGADVVVDGEEGMIYVEPSEDIVKGFKEHHSVREQLEEQKQFICSETFTKDGQKISLMANVNLFSDVRLAKELLCEGVGLYRSEFPFIIRSDFPTEEEQFVTYRKITEAMGDKPLLFRTLDIGGDKVLSYYQNAKEQNPFLGMRSIKFCLQNKGVFGNQIRAMLRAGFGADLWIMFPMISSVDEFIEAKEFVFDCMDELRERGQKFIEKPKIGMMVELPAVVELIDEFAKEAEFFSIGTNDFIQFMLGVDRTNENMAEFYLPYHPAVLRAIKKVVDASKKYGRFVSVCGDMAHYERYIPFLMGAGIRSLSIDPAYLPVIQKVIGNIDVDSAEKIAGEMLVSSRIEGISSLL